MTESNKKPRRRSGKGPQFVSYFSAVLDALRALNFSARPAEVSEWIAAELNLSDEIIEARNKSGQSKFENQVAWARFYLAKAGYIDPEQYGVWVLTEKGRSFNPSPEEALSTFRRIQAEIRNSSRSEREGDDLEEAESETAETEEETPPDSKVFYNEASARERLVEIVRNLSDTGFEELCALVLRSYGFENVSVTQRSGDKGIDGEGYLFLNRFVRTKVKFQCKRYEKTVGPEKIREFRGALRSEERGIFLTSGSFTRGAVDEANALNIVPIELVDIDRLLDILIEQKIGVRERRALEIDERFFDVYRPLKSSTNKL